jgi:alpha-L-arabinofuranosidase
VTCTVTLDGFAPAGEVEVRVLGGGRPRGTNTSTNPLNLVPRASRVHVDAPLFSYTFEPSSYTSLRLGAAR